MKRFKDFGIQTTIDAFIGDKIKMDRILNKEIMVEKYRIDDSKQKPGTKCLKLQLMVDGSHRVLFTGSTVLIDMIRHVPVNEFPFLTTIIKENERFEFS